MQVRAILILVGASGGDCGKPPATGRHGAQPGGRGRAPRAARRLRDQGLPLHDVGQALGVSFQRAKQLIDEADKLAS